MLRMTSAYPGEGWFSLKVTPAHSAKPARRTPRDKTTGQAAEGQTEAKVSAPTTGPTPSRNNPTTRATRDFATAEHPRTAVSDFR